MYTRIDTEMAMAVHRGIAMDAAKGAANAWVYMKYCSVPQQVILRVLAHPGRRRLLALAVAATREDSNANLATNVIPLRPAPA